MKAACSGNLETGIPQKSRRSTEPFYISKLQNDVTISKRENSHQNSAKPKERLKPRDTKPVKPQEEKGKKIKNCRELVF
ncbi:hypothetical protein CEXT_456151 [Caerostris extrusa]|uniref:Uncharacterized protein n=1 Tax=Caerostris extrusa TaxID=172846 RepID=A0AAV4RR92_CAEEX|nr:hypothetical protein CEXT_456151 [Caerostris extrusa]